MAPHIEREEVLNNIVRSKPDPDLLRFTPTDKWEWMSKKAFQSWYLDVVPGA